MLLIAIAGLVMLVSCSSDSGTNNTSGEIVLGTLEAKLDGKTWKSQQALATKISGFSYQIAGASATNITESISLTIPKTDVGTYSQGIGFINVLDLQNPMSGGKAYSNTNVTYTITEVDDEEISGTFSFVATNTANGQSDTRKVENGKFRVKFVN
jgi:hypothetical protein